MNDRFKFRTWDKENKKFLELVTRDEFYDTWISIDNTGVYQVERNNQTDKTFFNDITNDVEVNFCTGLKDCNGKLIYEGDILNVNTGSRDTSGIGEVVYSQCGCNFVLNGFLENPSGYYPRKKGEFHRNLQEWLCTEIIGNIYTTPELLEGKEWLKKNLKRNMQN